MKEIVSIIIPSYGRPNMLATSIASIAKQTYQHIEIIVVDDNGKGSVMQQETETVIANIECPFPIKYVLHETNQGGASARNTGVRHAEGNIIALLDNDDECLPDRISRQVDYLTKRNRDKPSVKGCSCLVIRQKHGKEIERQDQKQQENYLFESLALNAKLYCGSTLILYKETFENLGGFDEQFIRNQDLEFMVRFFEQYDLAVLNEHLVILNIDDRSNIPSYEKIVQTKELFMEKFRLTISKLTPDQQKEIYKNNALEIAKVALWNKNPRGFLKGMRQANLSFGETIKHLKEIVAKALVHLK